MMKAYLNDQNVSFINYETKTKIVN